VTVIVAASLPLLAGIVPGAALTKERLALGASAVPVAMNETGLPFTPGEVAVNVSGPATVPSVQLPTVAMPLALVVWLAPVTVPLRADVANVTVTPGTPFPFASFTITDGGVATAVFTVAVWPLPAFTAMLPAFPAVPVAVNVTGLPVSVPEVAVRVFVPAALPSVQPPTVATPLALVVWLPPPMLPPPDATANVTATPAIGLLFASVTMTAGAIGTGVPAVAVWLLPALTAMRAAGPALTVTVAVAVTTVVPFTLAVTVFVSALVELSDPVACPLALVVPTGCVMVFPVDGAAVSVTAAPLTGFPN
jgi:hypothetical protein